MSMILDALRRSREDSQQPFRGPPIHAPGYTGEERSEVPVWLSILVAVLVVVIVALAAMLFLQPSATPEPDAVSIPIGSQASDEPGNAAGKEPPSRVVNQSGEETSGRPEPVAEPDPSVAALYRERPEGAEAEARFEEITQMGSAEASDTASARETADLDRLVSEGGDFDGGPVEQAEETPIDIEEVVRRAQRAIGEVPLIPHGTPLLESLSQQQKDRIPTVLYSVHDWASGGGSSVVLNGQRLTVGQRHQGFAVTEILEDSVILSWGGVDFRLRALNSWVNL